MKRILGFLLAVVLLLSLVACAPTTTLQLVKVVVNTFVAAMQVDNPGWSYATLTQDAADLYAAWATDTTQQKVDGVNKIGADIARTPNCDAQCKKYVAVAVAGVGDVLIILEPNGSRVKGPMPSEKQQVETAYQIYKTRWNAVAPKKAQLN